MVSFYPARNSQGRQYAVSHGSWGCFDYLCDSVKCGLLLAEAAKADGNGLVPRNVVDRAANSRPLPPAAHITTCEIVARCSLPVKSALAH